jgi:hypothetical protein
MVIRAYYLHNYNFLDRLRYVRYAHGIHNFGPMTLFSVENSQSVLTLCRNRGIRIVLYIRSGLGAYMVLFSQVWYPTTFNLSAQTPRALPFSLNLHIDLPNGIP